MKATALILCLSFFCCSLWCGLCLNFTVNMFRGSDTQDCITDGLTPCKTLSYIIQQLQISGIDSNISIFIQSGLRVGVYHFENISNLRLMGTSGRRRYNRNCAQMPDHSGLIFSNVTDLYISNLFIRECGIPLSNHSVVMRILNCKNVILENSTFYRNRETALLFNNTFGHVSIINVNFENNLLFGTEDQFNSHSGGIEIIFSLQSGKNGTKSKYELESCMFINNTAPRDFHSYSTSLHQDSEWRGQSTGGGLGIFFQGNSSGNSITITNCTFVGNLAKWGGGMHVTFQGEAIDNKIEVIGSRYVSNDGEKAGGGVCIRYFTVHNRPNCCNDISFRHVNFSKNDGDFGAGTTILSAYSLFPSTGRMFFQNCTWSENTADHSPAMNIGPALFERLENGHLPIPEFDGCSFTENSLHTRQIDRFPDFFYKFSGTFIVTKSKLYFTGETKFLSNSDSALYINSGVVVFKEGSDVLFAGNRGSKGAAIAAYGYTSIILNRNSNFNFTQNHASELGAGIYYQSFDQHDFKTGRECFLKYNGSTGSSNNITIRFEDNKAEIAGTSVFASTLFPCFFSNSHELSQNDDKLLDSNVLDFIGDIQFDSINNNETALATSGRRFVLNNLKPLYSVIPGELVNIPLHLTDEFGRNIENSVSLLVTSVNKNITADRKYIIRGQLRLFGKPNASDTLRIIQDTPRKVILSIDVTMLDCPTGYYLDSQDDSCKCSSYNTNKSYYGLVRCDSEEFKAYLLRGFWVGYIPHDIQQPQHLYTAVCPLNFCKLNSMPKNMDALPGVDVTGNLSDSVCESNRQGILCGECTDGFSPFFHSVGYKCGSNDKCSVGIVFYILSELIPVVILFTLVIILDFSFTSGNINGFILFSQILETLSVDLRVHSAHTYRLMVVTRLFYDIFNFDYFSTDSLSFCLWKGATVIDLLAFKYVTVVFAFALVVCLILIMNRIRCSKIEEFLNIKERLSVTKGISAFLVICYLQCARTSFYLITPVLLRTQGGTPGDTVTFFGGLPFFKGRHLFYSIVAIFFITIFVTIPPLVLILYPLSLQILALCKLSEHWLVCKLLKIFQIYRLKPLIDSFQGCYRDKFRFFAGLYFLYRVVILAGYSITRSTSQFYVISQFLLITFLGIHSIIQPYKKKAHNVIDSCIFLNLLLINGCSIFIDVYNVQSRENQFAGASSIISLFIATQIILVYLPMLCFLIWMGRRLIMFASQHCKCAINKNLFKRQLLKDRYFQSNNSDDEGLFNTMDFHEMGVSSSKTENLAPATYQLPKCTERKPIKINTVAS